MRRAGLIVVLLVAGCGVDQCQDGISDGDESDVDCGGGCGPCHPGQLCFVNNDCSAGLCSGGVCPSPSCLDGVKNGKETDIDCGGGACPGCDAERVCHQAVDCASLVCTNTRCDADPHCSNGKLDGGESDVDCGGGCNTCLDGRACMLPTDCASGACTAGVCGAGSPCSDGKLDGDESDVDCGGSCDRCPLGKVCGDPADCQTGICNGGLCSSPMPLQLQLTLSTRVSAGTGNAASYIASGDFNGDKKADLVVIAESGNAGQAAVLLGDGKGGLGAPQLTDLSGESNSVAVADFNGDGKSDVVVGALQSSATVLLGSLSGKLGMPTYLNVANPVLVMAGDVTGDKRPDIVAVDQPFDQATPATAIVFIGAGNGTFQPNAPLQLGIQPSYGTIADFNHDGRKDLMFANVGTGMGDDGALGVLLGKGGGQFAPSVDTQATRPRNVVAGDWNGDGRADLFYFAMSFGVYTSLGKGDGTFKAPLPITDPNVAVGTAAADFDLDGRLDLVTCDDINFNMGALSVYLGNGDGTFQTATTFAHVGGPIAVVVGDFDGDGKPDLATTDDQSRVNIYLNTSN